MAKGLTPFFILALGIFFGFIIILLAPTLLKKSASAQAKELFTLFFEIDTARHQSAEIFAELLELKENPGREHTEQKLGQPPPLSSSAELLDRLRKNQQTVGDSLELITSKSFSDKEISTTHTQVRSFYSK